MPLDRDVGFRELFRDYPDLPWPVTGRLYYRLAEKSYTQTINQILKLKQEELFGLPGLGVKTTALLLLLLERNGWLEQARSWPLEGAVGRNILREMGNLRPSIPQRRD